MFSLNLVALPKSKYILPYEYLGVTLKEKWNLIKNRHKDKIDLYKHRADFYVIFPHV